MLERPTCTEMEDYQIKVECVDIRLLLHFVSDVHCTHTHTHTHTLLLGECIAFVASGSDPTDGQVVVVLHGSYTLRRSPY